MTIDNLGHVIDQVRAAADIVAIVGERVVLAKGGQNLVGLCPFHGEKSGSFMVHPGRQTFKCFGCGEGGDVFDFLMRLDSLTFLQALTFLAERYQIPMPGAAQGGPAHRPATPRPLPQAGPEFTPATYGSPSETWMAKAHELVTACHLALMANPAALKYLAGRGISPETARQYALGWNAGDAGRDLYRNRPAWGLPELRKESGKLKSLWIPRGLVIPTLVDGQVWRIKIRRPTASRKEFLPDRKYIILEGGSSATMVLRPEAKAFVVVEAELDGLACVQAAGDMVGAVALGSMSNHPDAPTTKLLQDSLCVLNALDMGDAKEAAKENGIKAQLFWARHFANNKRWPVPAGKDPGEAVAKGVDLRAWLVAGLPPACTLFPVKPEGAQQFVFLSSAREGAEVVPAIPGPAPVRELAALLHKAHAVIDKSRHELAIRKPAGVATSVATRISELVFFDEIVEQHLATLPDGRITAAMLAA